MYGCKQILKIAHWSKHRINIIEVFSSISKVFQGGLIERGDPDGFYIQIYDMVQFFLDTYLKEKGIICLEKTKCFCWNKFAMGSKMAHRSLWYITIPLSLISHSREILTFLRGWHEITEWKPFKANFTRKVKQEFKKIRSNQISILYYKNVYNFI